MNKKQLNTFAQDLLETDESVDKVLKRHFTIPQKLPTRGQLSAHFLRKWYPNLHICDDCLQNYSRTELEMSVYELIERALFLRFNQQKNESKNLVSKAEKIADYLENSFIDSYCEFALGLQGDELKMKLQVEFCNDCAYKGLATDRQKALVHLSTGLALADKVADQRKKLDLIGKCHYALYEIGKHNDAALVIGEYLLNKTKNYRALRLWVHFHNGNANLAMKNKEKMAKEEFDESIKLAVEHGNAYAIMTVKERLALTYRKLNDFDLARQCYQESLVISETKDIPSPLVLQNTVRCIIGLGLLDYITARNSGRKKNELRCKSAEELFKEAAELARQINYCSNEATALRNLGSVYEFMYGNGNKDAMTFYKMADDTLTKIS